MEFVGILIISIIYFILHKKGIVRLRSQTQIFWKASYTPNRYKVSYKKFDGVEYHRFWVKKGSKVTVSYDVTVETGSLLVEFWHTTKKSYFRKEFNTDESGAFSFKADKRMYTLRLEGFHTKGGCIVELEKKVAPSKLPSQTNKSN